MRSTVIAAVFCLVTANAAGAQISREELVELFLDFTRDLDFVEISDVLAALCVVAAPEVDAPSPVS